MALVDSLVVFLGGLLVGGLAIYIAARAVLGVKDYSHAIITALVGSLVYAVVTWLLPNLAGIGPLLALVAWLAVIKGRYRCGWVNAALIGLASWIAVVIILYILAVLEITTFGAVGIPGA